jgi:hypothetical protein
LRSDNLEIDCQGRLYQQDVKSIYEKEKQAFGIDALQCIDKAV